eukprot:4798048-Prorocentrum_lima.AAC.1
MPRQSGRRCNVHTLFEGNENLLLKVLHLFCTRCASAWHLTDHQKKALPCDATEATFAAIDMEILAATETPRQSRSRTSPAILEVEGDETSEAYRARRKAKRPRVLSNSELSERLVSKTREMQVEKKRRLVLK